MARSFPLFGAAFVAVGLSAGTAGAGDGTPGEDGDSMQGIVELAPGATIEAVNAKYGFTTVAGLATRGLYLVAMPEAWTEQDFEALSQPASPVFDPLFSGTQLNHASGDQGSGTQSMFLDRSVLSFLDQPVWSALGVPAAQQVATGAGVVVAVIDGGLDASHPLLAGRVSPDAINLLGDPGAWGDSANGLDDDGDGLVDEMQGHGTFVAGIIAAAAPGAVIMPIRVMNDEGVGDGFAVALGIYHAIDHGARVINLSLGSETELRSVERAVDEAVRLGIVVVASAGNESEQEPEFPAGTNYVVGVGSTDLSGVVSGFSNLGDHLVACAPGEQIVGPRVGGYGEADGTSASAPLVSALAALLVEAGTVRRYDDFREMVKATAVDIEPINPGLEDLVGFGMIDYAAAVAWPGPCYGDLTDDDLLNVEDVQAFVAAWLAGDEAVDLAEPRGVLNVDDVQFWAESFVSGCPGQ